MDSRFSWQKSYIRVSLTLHQAIGLWEFVRNAGAIADLGYCYYLNFLSLVAVIIFICFNLIYGHSFFGRIEGAFSKLKKFLCGRQRLFNCTWVFECAYFLGRSLWMWWKRTSCSPVWDLLVTVPTFNYPITTSPDAQRMWASFLLTKIALFYCA